MKIVSIKDAIAGINDGATIMVGGFLACGTPEPIIDALVEKGVKDLTLICNDTATPTTGIGKLVANNQVKKVIATHIGTNPITGQKMNDGTMEVELSPQGTLAERIRSGGAGLGGVLTPTGVGTEVAEGKQVLNIDGKDYLLEKPLRADFALIGATIADEKGNLYFTATSKNFNTVMATAADVVIAGAELIVPVGDIQPENVAIPAIMSKERIARRVARDLNDGDVVNLGIGLPTMVADYVPEGIEITLQSENGILGMGPLASSATANKHLINSGGQNVTVLPGAAYFDSAFSFMIIRGGHVDMTVLGALQVDAHGNLASHIVPGKMVPGMGGAMDLVTGSKKVVVAMTHTAKDGAPKILKDITLPATAIHAVDEIVTELAVIKVTDEGLVLTELAEGVSVEDVIAKTEAPLKVADDLKTF